MHKAREIFDAIEGLFNREEDLNEKVKIMDDLIHDLKMWQYVVGREKSKYTIELRKINE